MPKLHEHLSAFHQVVFALLLVDQFLSRELRRRGCDVRPVDEFSSIGVGKIKEGRQHPRRQFNTHRIDPIKRFTHRQVVENIFDALSDQRLKIRQVARGDRWRNSRSLMIMAWRVHGDKVFNDNVCIF